MYAWTLYCDKDDVSDWAIDPSTAQRHVHKAIVSSHTSGTKFLIPKHIRDIGWLPKWQRRKPVQDRVIRQIFEEEHIINVWTVAIFDVCEWRLRHEPREKDNEDEEKSARKAKK